MIITAGKEQYGAFPHRKDIQYLLPKAAGVVRQQRAPAYSRDYVHPMLRLCFRIFPAVFPVRHNQHHHWNILHTRFQDR